MTTIDPAAAAAEMQTHIARCDTKAGLLLAGIAAGLALAAGAAPALPTAARAGAGATVAALTVATVLLLLVVRPRPGGGFTADRMLTGDPHEHLTRLCTLATTKYLLIRRAVDVLLVAVALAAITAAVALATT